MPRMRVPIAQGFYVDESIPVAAQECVNLYPHIPTNQTITDAALVGVGGLSQVAFTATNAFNRGSHVMLGIPYFVNGNKLYNVTYTTDAFGVRTYTTNLLSGATLIGGTAQCFFANNGYQICIVAPDLNTKFNTWIYTVAGGLVAISDADFDGPVSGVSFSDGYFIFPKLTGNKFFISDLRDGTNYIATDFTSSQSDPNPIASVFPLRGQLFVFGGQSFETYQNVGGAGFPYQRINGQTYNKGCSAPQSVAEIDGALVFIGAGVNEKPCIWITDGGLPQKLSTAPIDNLIFSGGYTPVQNAYVVKWAEKGHFFLAFTVPNICTVVYDSTTKIWHTRESIDYKGAVVPWLPTCIANAYSVLLVGDPFNGRIGLFDSSIYTEYGSEILARFSTPAISADGKPLTIHYLELEMQTGTVPLDGQGSNPVINLAVSSDGGRTFTPAMPRTFGLTGEYTARVIWSRLGRFARSVVFRWSISEPIKRVMVKAEAEIGA